MRARITERLVRASASTVTLMTAPAGFGKSVALRDFLTAANVEAIRYDVRREDSSLLGFARGLAMAIEPIAPGASASFPEMQSRVMELPNSVGSLAEWFSEHLNRASATIVIDDLHFAAADPGTTALLSDLIERTDDGIKWIVATRTDAGLPVATWLAYGRMDMPIDERELRFTPEEALAIAGDVREGSVDPDEVESLRQLTDGWAVALAIALRTRTHASDLRAAASGTREFVYRYLAEQVFAGLTAAQRAFVLATSVFSSFDVTIARALGASLEFLAELRRGVAFLSEADPGNYRYHDLFRDYAENELRREGEPEWRAALRAGGRLLEERRDVPAALELYVRAADMDAILRLLERDGVRLFERGHADALSAALDAIPEERRSQDAAAIGLHAMLAAARGHFDVARREFTVAIERAKNDELRYALVHRYALELVRQEHDSAELLNRYARDDSVAASLRVPLLGTLATALARGGNQSDAVATLSTALDLLDPVADDDTRARLFQQAAFVYLWQNDHADARAYATLAVDLAIARNLHEVAVRGYSVLYQIAYDDADDPVAALAILSSLLHCALKGGSTQARLFGLMASYWIQAERGDEAALIGIEKALDAIPGALPRARDEALLPATALRAAWDGDFRRAHRLLRETASGLGTPERRASRASSVALYAFAGGLAEEGQASLDEAMAALAACERPTRRALTARIMLALAEIARGHASAAHRHLVSVERALTPPMRRLRALAAAARALQRQQLGQAEGPALAASLERLRAEQFGGMARLLEAIPFPDGRSGGYALLTGAEREILRLLAAGASTKDAAAQTGRSPRTVDTHIRSICQKLGCTSRRAAVAIATGAGWVET
jgi:LuxR family transcriptional regulator, maltose regulon positive regulatory protein